jgi:hypothetical protein
MLRSLRDHARRHVVGYIALVVVLAGSAYAAYASIPDNGVIHGCYKPYDPTQGKPGAAVLLRETDTGCPEGYTSIDWNQQGPTGQDGSQGPPGPRGPRGLSAAEPIRLEVSSKGKIESQNAAALDAGAAVDRVQLKVHLRPHRPPSVLTEAGMYLVHLPNADLKRCSPYAWSTADPQPTSRRRVQNLKPEVFGPYEVFPIPHPSDGDVLVLVMRHRWRGSQDERAKPGEVQLEGSPIVEYVNGGFGLAVSC